MSDKAKNLVLSLSFLPYRILSHLQILQLPGEARQFHRMFLPQACRDSLRSGLVCIVLQGGLPGDGMIHKLLDFRPRECRLEAGTSEQAGSAVLEA